MTGVHAEAVTVQGHGRDAFPGKGIGITSPDGVGGPHAETDLMCHVGDHLTDGRISGDTDHSAANQLAGQIHVHVKLM